MTEDRSLPPGSQPYDPANGLRIGGFAGGLAGAGLTVLLGPGAAWAIFVGAAVGAATGYGIARQRIERWRRTH